MTALVIAAALVAAYLLAGWRTAVRRLPVAWEHARDHWSFTEYVRSSVRWQTIGVLLGWPVFLICHLVTRRLDGVIDRGDPVALTDKLAERERHIAQLERELGMKP